MLAGWGIKFDGSRVCAEQGEARTANDRNGKIPSRWSARFRATNFMMRRSSAERVGRVLCSSGGGIVAHSRRNAKRKMVSPASEGEERFLPTRSEPSVASLGMSDFAFVGNFAVVRIRRSACVRLTCHYLQTDRDEANAAGREPCGRARFVTARWLGCDRLALH